MGFIATKYLSEGNYPINVARFDDTLRIFRGGDLGNLRNCQINSMLQMAPINPRRKPNCGANTVPLPDFFNI